MTKGVAVIGAAAVGAGLAIGKLVFSTADYGDEVAKTSKKLGISTDSLQEMNYWAERNGLSSNDLERAVGRLNQRIGRAADGNQKYADAFDAIDVSLKDSQGNLRDTEDVMSDTIQTLSEIEDPQLRSARASEIFGTKMARELMPALEDGALSMEDAAEKAHEMGLVMDEDALAAAERFGDEWADLKDTAMGFLREAAVPIMQWLGDELFPWLKERLIPALQEFGEWLGPKLEEAGQTVQAVWNDYVQPAFQALQEWWEENGPTIVARLEEVFGVIEDVWNGLGDLINQVVEWFQGGEESINDSTQGWSEFLTETWERIQEVVSSAVDAVIAIYEFFVDVVTFIWENWGENILNILESLWGLVQTVIQEALDIVMGIFEIFAGVFTGDWDRAWEGVKEIFSSIWTIIEEVFRHAMTVLEELLDVALDILKGLWDAAWGWVRDKAEEWWDKITSSIDNAIDDALQFFRDLPGDILDAIGDVGSLLWGIGEDIVQGFIDGVRNMFSSVEDTFNSLTSWIPDWKGPHHVDVKLLRGPAEDIMAGFADDLEAFAVKDVEPAMQATTSLVSGSVSASLAAGSTSPQRISNDNNSLTIEKVEIAGRDIEDMRDISDFFTRVQQVARAGVQ